MEIQHVYVKTRAEYGKQCIFDTQGPNLDLEIAPRPSETNDYIVRSHCHVGEQRSKQLALHEVQTIATPTRNTGMFHFEGGWPKEINPRDEETTQRFRRRVEKDDDWAPKLRKLFEIMEHSIRQNGTTNIYQHYFDDIIPTPLVHPLGLRTVNVYADPKTPARPVNDISWSPDSGSRIVVSYCFLEFGRLPDYSNTVYIWQVDNPNKPYMALEAFCPTVVSEFNHRDPSVLASGLMSGQVCNWDIRTGTTPVQLSHLQFSHRHYAHSVKWLSSKSNTEFFSASTDGFAMWWDTRKLREPTEVLMFDLENPNEPDIDNAIGVSSLNFGPMMGTKFMFGMENGLVVSGSRRAKSNAEKLALRFEAHYGPVIAVDRNVFNPAVFLSVGDWTARVWLEDTKEGCLASTCIMSEFPTGCCWNKGRHSCFYIITGQGILTTWDLLQNLREPVLKIKLCDEKLTAIAPHEEGSLLAIGNSVGKVYLVESTEALGTFDKTDRAILSEYLERCSRFTKTVDTRLKEMKLIVSLTEPPPVPQAPAKVKKRSRPRKGTYEQDKHQRVSRPSKERGKKSVQKEKRRIREEFPELAEVEEKYFQIVEQEKEQYLGDSESVMDPSWHTSSSGKRHDGRKGKKVQQEHSVEDIQEEIETSKSPKSPKQPRERKSKVQRTKSTSPKVSERVRSIGESHLRISDTAEQGLMRSGSGSVSRSRSGSRRRGIKRKTGRRSSRRRISFKLPVPCEGRVCRPRVCCRPTDSAIGRAKLGRDSGAKSIIRRAERGSSSSSRDDGEAAAGQQRDSRAMRDGSVSKLMDGSASMEGGLRQRRNVRKRLRILREMLEPPTELTEEVKSARREIRRARSLTGTARRRYIFQRILESRPKTRSQEKVSWRLKDDEVGYSDSTTDDRTGRVEIPAVDPGKKEKKGYKKDPAAVPYDVCSPRGAKSIEEEFAALLGSPVESMEVKPKQGKVYLEELEAIRSRVYPRISEFHSIE